MTGLIQHVFLVVSHPCPHTQIEVIQGFLRHLVPEYDSATRVSDGMVGWWARRDDVEIDRRRWNEN